MTSTTGINIPTSSVPPTQATGTPASSANAAAANVASTTKAPTTAASISPRIIDDPTAGIITQYLNSSGKVTNQFPSSVAVAYLRAGLTQDGGSKHHDTSGATTVA